VTINDARCGGETALSPERHQRSSKPP